MTRGRLRPWNIDTMRNLIAVSRGQQPADLLFTGGYVLDVYNGELIEANLAVKGQRVAYIGASDAMIGAPTQVIQLEGRILVPGYIEPHAHPFTMHHPLAFADEVLSWGTTCSVNDDLLFMNLMSPDQIIAMVESISEHPHKMLWSARLDPQTFSPEQSARFTREAVSQLIRHQGFAQVGELTDWPSLIAGHENMQQWLLEALSLGKKAEGHAPGASERTLNPLAAAGVTACHESINAEDVLLRLRMGMYATLRNSSLRPDLATILKGLMHAKHKSWERLMMTTDAPKPAFLKKGLTNTLVEIAIENGVAPITAYQMVTRNPAVYLGLDNEIGGLAPGRLADILVLNRLDEPTPAMVFADGKLAVERKGLEVHRRYPLLHLDWKALGVKALPQPAVNFKDLPMQPAFNGETIFPVMELIDPVITRRRDYVLGQEIKPQGGKLHIEKGHGLCYAALISRDYTRITHGIVYRFARELDAIAASNTASADLVVLGQDTDAMQLALRRINEMGGGIVVIQKGRIAAQIALPLGGSMNPDSMPYVIEASEQIEQVLAAAGYPHHELFYSLRFLSSTHLPAIRLTRDGVVEVKTHTILRPSLPVIGASC